MKALLPNTYAYTATGCDTELLDLVAFKWLMAGIGWWVDVPRLRRDADYARICAQRGLESGQPVLGERAAELLATLTGTHTRRVHIIKRRSHIMAAEARDSRAWAVGD